MEGLLLSILGLFGAQEPVVKVDVQVKIEIVMPAEETQRDEMIIRW